MVQMTAPDGFELRQRSLQPDRVLGINDQALQCRPRETACQIQKPVEINGPTALLQLLTSPLQQLGSVQVPGIAHGRQDFHR